MSKQLKYKDLDAELRAKDYLDSRFRMTFYLGGLYIYEGKIVKFIKVTAKGFNLLDETTNKCVLKKHLYSYKHGKGIPIPEGVTQVHAYVPADFRTEYRGQAV